MDNTHLQTLEGHAYSVFALEVGQDGRIYSGSVDNTIRVWSSMDNTHLQTLEGHTHGVCTLAVGQKMVASTRVRVIKPLGCGVVWTIRTCKHSRGAQTIYWLLLLGRTSRLLGVGNDSLSMVTYCVIKVETHTRAQLPYDD